MPAATLTLAEIIDGIHYYAFTVNKLCKPIESEIKGDATNILPELLLNHQDISTQYVYHKNIM